MEEHIFRFFKSDRETSRLKMKLFVIILLVITILLAIANPGTCQENTGVISHQIQTMIYIPNRYISNRCPLGQRKDNEGKCRWIVV